MEHRTPLHQLDPLTRFADRAQDYAHYRPSYPAAALDAVLAGLAGTMTVADVGAGTGIGSRLLGDRGLSVWAVEPNAAMRDAAASHPQVTWVPGTAEQTGLAERSVDLVTCFQAFHWFEPAASLQEFRRILRSPGRLALVWNDRDRTDGFTAAYSDLVRIASNQHPAATRRLHLTETVLAPSPWFENVQQQRFDHAQAADLEGLIGRAHSTSYIPRQGPAHDQFLTQVTQLFWDWADGNGHVYLRYDTHVYLADVR